MSAPRRLACSSSSSTSMPAPSPSTKPSRWRSNGREALCGASLRVERAVKQVEAGHAERMDHAVRAADQHQVGVAVANQLGCLADGLAAGGAGRQAVVIRPAQVEVCGQVRRRRVQFLFGLALGMKRRQAAALELRPYRTARFCGWYAWYMHGQQIVEVLDALAGAEVDAEAIAVHAACRRADRRAAALPERRRRRTDC